MTKGVFLGSHMFIAPLMELSLPKLKKLTRNVNPSDNKKIEISALGLLANLMTL